MLTLIRTGAGKTDTERERFHTISEVARLLEVSDQSIRRWIKAGELKAYKPKKEYRIAESDLQEFLEGRAVPLVQTPSPEPSLFNGLEDERRETPYDIALNAARRQAEQEAQAENRALESGRAQTYFMHHENAAAVRLLQHSADELAGDLLEMARHVQQLEEALASAKAPLSLENFPAEQVAAFLAENEQDKERIRRELEKLSANDLREMMLASPPLRRLSEAYRKSAEERAARESADGS
jgi:excisionase family DNA binding protein